MFTTLAEVQTVHAGMCTYFFFLLWGACMFGCVVYICICCVCVCVRVFVCVCVRARVSLGRAGGKERV